MPKKTNDALEMTLDLRTTDLFDDAWKNAASAAEAPGAGRQWRERVAHALRLATNAEVVCVLLFREDGTADQSALGDAATAQPVLARTLEKLSSGAPVATAEAGRICVAALVCGPSGRRYGAMQIVTQAGALDAWTPARLARVAKKSGDYIEQALALAQSFVAQGAAPNTPGVDLSMLTKREREVVELVVGGFSDLNAASILGVSEDTVGTHLHRAFRKLSVHSRVELTRKLLGKQG
jgi:ATP/maltotriose-dependent transcriptional regulator MalT